MSTSYHLYQESLLRLETGKGDARDEAFVALWKSSKELVLRVKSLTSEKDLLAKRVAEYNFKLDVALTRQLPEQTLTFSQAELMDDTIQNWH